MIGKQDFCLMLESTDAEPEESKEEGIESIVYVMSGSEEENSPHFSEFGFEDD